MLFVTAFVLHSGIYAVTKLSIRTVFTIFVQHSRTDAVTRTHKTNSPFKLIILSPRKSAPEYAKLQADRDKKPVGILIGVIIKQCMRRGLHDYLQGMRIPQ